MDARFLRFCPGSRNHLLAGCSTHPIPFGRIDNSVMVRIEAGEQRWLVPLPIAQQRRKRAVRTLHADTAETAEGSDRVQLLVRSQSVLRIAILARRDRVQQPPEQS